MVDAAIVMLLSSLIDFSEEIPCVFDPCPHEVSRMFAHQGYDA